MRRHIGHCLLPILLLTGAAARPATPESTAARLYQAMRWRLVGPFRGGRVEAVAGISGNPAVYYFGAVAGGVWKTTDGGLTWQPVFEQEPVASIGAIAVAPSDPNVIYVGTGEACLRNDISFGDGVYKSTDGGKTWTHEGLDDTRHIGRIEVDPRNPDVVFVAALGHAYGPNSDRGVFRSRDGGRTWQKVLYRDENSGAVDLAMDPNNPRVLFAALYQVRRTPWGLTSGGPGSGLYRSSDGGDHWEPIRGHGLPTGTLGRIGVAVAADSNRIYALVEATDGGLYRSDDGGGAWQRVNADYELRGRPWYYSHVFADPRNPDVVYVFSFGSVRSTDGGTTFKPVEIPHGDYHALWIDPANPNRMIAGDDGGATVSTDGGKSWTAQDNQPTGQFYHIAADNRFNYYLYGSQQDRGTVAITTRSEGAVIDGSDWYAVAGGESGFVWPSPLDPNIVYAGSLYSAFTRFDRRTGQATDISPWPVDLLNLPAKDAKYRLGWTAPMLFSPHDPRELYIGAQVLLKTTDDGQTWSVASPDLTRNDKSKQESSGGPLTQDNTTAEYYDQIAAIAESPVRKDLLWVGTDDGLIQLSTDGGKQWTNVTPAQMPEWSMVSSLEASPFDAGTAYAAIDRHRLDDFRPYVFRTTDSGKTWNAISAGLPSSSYVHAVREDPQRAGLLYAGTETGVYVSFDGGGIWQSLQLNLPTTPVYDLVVHGNDLAIATHGRGFWVLDDLEPLRQEREAGATTDFYLYKPEPAFRVRGNGFFPGAAAPPGDLAGQNPPAGAVIDYFLAGRPRRELQLQILDANGRQVRSFRGEGENQRTSSMVERLPTSEGHNRFVWNLTYEGPKPVAGEEQGEGFGSSGPLAVPGSYTVRLTVEGRSQTQPLVLREDPRVRVTTVELQKQFELAIQIRDSLSDANQALSQMSDVRKQLEGWQARLGKDPRASAVVKAIDSLQTKTLHAAEAITGWKVVPGRYSLNYPPALDDKLAFLASYVAMGDGAPGQPYQEVYAQLHEELESALQAWRSIQARDLHDLNDLMRKQGIPAVSPTTGGAPGEDHPAAANRRRPR